MTRYIALIAVASGLLAASTPHAWGFDPEWRTSPPVTYVLDYGRDHIDNPDYIAAIAASPPSILHLGKDLVMSHNWGPIEGVGGENQAGGKGDAIRRLSPEETRERFEALERMVTNLHEAGVPVVMPYICSITLGGHHERRTGFWEFYDHWDEYLEFLPPRPELDPVDWMQRLPDGTLKPTYGSKPDEDEFYPPYEPNLRYAACINNPGWRTWIDAVVRLVAAVGYDGAFIDNGSTQQCYCGFCEEKYQGFIRGRYSEAEIRDLFGAGPHETIGLTPPPGRGDDITLGWVESQRFWRESIYDHQQAMRRAGEEVSDRFILFPNGGHNRPEVVKQSYRDTEYIMYELSRGDYGTNPGLVRSRIVDDIHMNVRNNNIWQYKYTQATRTGLAALILTRGGYPGTRAAWALNPMAAELGNAEAAAFGSGAGFLLRPRWSEYDDVLNRYRRFFEEHADVYTGLVPWAQVGVAAFGEQNFYRHGKHITTVERLVEELSAEQVLFDLLTKEAFTAEHLAQFDALVFPDVKYATPEQIAALTSYVQGGGRAMVIGDTPTHDMQMRPLDQQTMPAALRQLADGAEAPATAVDGEGTWLRYDRLPLDRLVAPLQGEGPALSIASEAGPGVRVNAFADPDGSRLTLHVLNYDTPLGAEPEPLGPREDLALRLPIPAGAGVVSVRLLAPDAEPLDAQWEVADERLQVTLPDLRVYAVLQVQMQ